VKTFLDSGVLITAFQGQTEAAQKALQLLNDPTREFIASAFLKLEVLPQPTWNKRQIELEFYRAFFSGVHHYASASETLAEAALEIAANFGLEAMDALHVVVASSLGAAEFFTTEKLTKPIHRLNTPKVIFLPNYS
jgi:predicted nucleic acid-binding protein